MSKTILYIGFFIFFVFVLINCTEKKESPKDDFVKKNEEKSTPKENIKVDTTEKNENISENINQEKNNNPKNETQKKETPKDTKKIQKEENPKQIKKEEEQTNIEKPKKVYDKVQPYYNGRAVAQSGKKYCLLNQKGEEVTPLKYDFLEGFDVGGDMIRARIQDKVGYLDRNGNEIIPLSFRYVERFNKGLAQAKLIDGETFYINKQGQKVCDILDKYYEGMARIKVGKNIGYINEQGIIVVPALYSYGTNFTNGVADVKKIGDDHIFTINKQGVCVKDCK
ncbi:MAG: hypothetical protein EAZ85_15475 [Bacteroidetes bacterium]|nr:MAG: hypothetical protein EAZ85_15475 [Bacteroidota bacterium]TAG92330.1 MAG: hypothetical protein EAZ20_02605 [Bacteroidota bacterium]